MRLMHASTCVQKSVALRQARKGLYLLPLQGARTVTPSPCQIACANPCRNKCVSESCLTLFARAHCADTGTWAFPGREV